MGTLTQCILRAGKALDKGDAKAIRDLRDQLKAEGLSESDAARESVSAQIKAASAARDELLRGTPVSPAALPDLPNYREYEVGVSVEQPVADYATDDYQVARDAKTGKVTVTGDIDAARAALPEGIRGRATKSGLSFSGSAAIRAYSALRGDINTFSRAGEVTKHPVKDGKYVGAPEKYSTPAKISKLRQRLNQLAQEGEPGKMWYESSSQAILNFVGGDKAEAKKFAALLAIYSAQSNVDSNTTFAVRAWAQHKAGRPINVSSKAKDRKATQALTDADAFWSGEKTGNFVRNLLVEIDESYREGQGATIDMWMMRAGEYATDLPNRSQYAFMENEMNRLAQNLGWSPHQVQAAIWVALKARYENKGVKARTNARSIKRGWAKRSTNSQGKNILVVTDAQKHRDNWLEEAYKLDVQPSDTAVAKFDFADGLRRHVGKLGTTDADLGILAALTDDAGSDLLAMQLGILAESGDVIVAPAKGDPGQSNADPAMIESLNIYAHTLRQLTGASQAYWWRPFYKARVRDQNAVMIHMDREATDAEIEAAEQVVEEHADGAPWRDSFAILKDRDGMVLINQGAFPNADLKTIAQNPAILGDAEQFAADASIITGENNGKLAGIGTERQRAVLAWARGFVEAQGAEAATEIETGVAEDSEVGYGTSEIYDRIDTRSGTTERQRATGRSAVRDVERWLQSFVERGRAGDSRGGNVSVLGQRLLAGFKAGEPGQLVGAKIENAQDLAALAQVYRNPKFETLRVIYLRGDNVVGESAFTSRMPGSVSFSGKQGLLASTMRSEMGRVGADGYMILHNHPAGNATPSDPDRSFTIGIAAKFGGFRGHVIVDFNEYAALDNKGRGEPIQKDFGATDFTATPEIPHPSLGRKITSPNVLADIAKQIQAGTNYAVILTNSQGEVNQVTSLPADFFVLVDQDQAKAKVLLRSMAREAGSVSAFLVLPERETVAQRRAMEANSQFFRDVIDAYGQRVGNKSGRDSLLPLVPGAVMVSDRLAGLPETVEVDGKQVKFEDFPKAKAAAQAYMKRKGLPYNEPQEHAELDRARATRIAEEFERMEHNPQDPEVKAAYDAMIDETLEQYEAILDTGLTVRFNQGQDPYGNPRNAILDVIGNNNLFVFPTLEGFGSNDSVDVSDNPLLRETKFKTADGDAMLANDVFRVVHDYFGHIKNGVGFRARGEESAWQSHAAMYSPLARRAMTTETRGQNSWVNFGPYAESNKTASGADTVYADQKIGILPLWVSEEGRLSGQDRRTGRGRTEGLEGAIVDGRLQLSHYSQGPIDRNDPRRAGAGLDRKVAGRRYIPPVTYFGITQADENGYRREAGLGRVETPFSLPIESIYPADADPESLWVRGDHQASIDAMKAEGYSGYWSEHRALGKVAVVWDELQSDVVQVNEDVSPYEVNQGGLYSAIERAVVDAKIPGLKPSKRNPAGAIRAESWLQYLRNRSIKQEEWKWTGLRDLLSADPRRRLTRDELLAEVRERQAGRDETSPALEAEAADQSQPAFRSGDTKKGMTASAVREAVANMPAALQERMFVAQSVDELPDHVKDEMRRQGASSISGYFDRRTQRVWLVADAIRNKKDAQVTLLHESVGHRGIEAVMGPKIGEFLQMVDGARYDQVISDAYKYVERMYPGASPVVQAAEVVARIAESDPKHNLMQRVYQWFRQTLRRLGFDVAFTNGDIVEALRRAKGATPGQAANTGGLFRVDGAPFKRWFGNSKVVDESGQPLVVYHGTPGSDGLTEFDIGRAGSRDGGFFGLGAYFTTDVVEAEEYGYDDQSGEDGSVVEAYVSLQNPFVFDLSEEGFAGTKSRLQELGIEPRGDNRFTFNLVADQPRKFTEAAKKAGYDGVIVRRQPWQTQDGEASIEEVVAFEPRQIKSATGNRGTYDPGSSNILFRADEGQNLDPERWSVPDERWHHAVIRKMQDKFLPLKRLQETISEAGGVITEESDAYLAEELFHGKAESDMRIATDAYIKPLAEKMAEFGITHAELDDYLYAMHAPERNAHIASINEKMPDGGSGMTDRQAGEILARARRAGKMEQLQELEGYVRGLLDAQREMILTGGLEDDGTVEAWQAKYNHYVPLKGFAEDTKKMDKPKAGPRTGQGFQIRGPESQRAMGRGSLAASPLSFAIMDLSEKIIRKRKNEVGNALLKLAEDNPNPDYWEIFTDENPDITRRIVRKRDPETGEMRDVVTDVAADMRRSDDYFMTKRDGQAYFLKLHDEQLIRAMKNMGPEQMNRLLQAGAAVNRFLSAMNTSYAPEFIISNFTRDYQTAFLNLQAEQSLGDKGKAKGNRIRINLKRVMRSRKAIAMSLAGKKARKPELVEMQQWFDEFREAGAKTGYFDRKDIDGIARDMNALVKVAEGGFTGTTIREWRRIKEGVENLNDSVENAVRLAAYISGREEGLTIKQAASLAKNMTVNFNRRGEIGSSLNAVYMFANASIQGTANFARTMLTFKPQGEGVGRLSPRRLNNAQRIAVALVAASYTLSAVNRMLGDDDDDGQSFYDKIPDYDRERNIILMKSVVLPDAKSEDYWKIPLPYGYNIFHVLGDNMEAVASGGRPAIQSAMRTVVAVLGSFSPIGFQNSDKSLWNLFLLNATPSPVKPVVELGLNENFAGSTIYTENLPFGTPKPASSLGRRTTPWWAEGMATWMNKATGGNEQQPGKVDVNPDVIEHIMDHFTGSAGSFVSRASDNISDVLQGVPLESEAAVMSRRLTGTVRPYDDQTTFYQRRDEVNQAFERMKALQGDERREFRDENGGLLKLRGWVKKTENKLKLKRKIRDRIYENEDLSAKERDAKLKAIEEEMEQIVDEFNAAYVEAAQ